MSEESSNALVLQFKQPLVESLGRVNSAQQTRIQSLEIDTGFIISSNTSNFINILLLQSVIVKRQLKDFCTTTVQSRNFRSIDYLESGIYRTFADLEFSYLIVNRFQ